MRPLSLQLRGFTAFRQHTELDFADLELFALVGPTGSGKSSLLDAVTFALYGETARLGASGMEALISQGERALLVELTFEAAGETYRVTRTRGRKASDNELRFERLEGGNVDGGEWVGLNTGTQRDIGARIEGVVGLDFSTFTRCVLLPQGQFAALLHGKARQRQELLGELLGLSHVGRMHAVAGDRVKDFKHQSQTFGTLLTTEYAGVSAEAVQTLRAEREALSTELETLAQAREGLLARQGRLRDGEKVWRAHEEAGRRLKAEEARGAGVADWQAKAARARRVAAALPLLDQAERSRIALERERREWDAAVSALRGAQAASARAQAEQRAAEEAATRIPELERRAEELRGAERDAAQLRRAGAEVSLSHPGPLPWDEDAYHTAAQGAERAEKLRTERRLLETERAALQAERDRLSADEALQRSEQESLERLKQEGQRVKAELDAARKAEDEARFAAGLAAYRPHLHMGEPCPLCEQVVRRLPEGEGADLAALGAEVQVLDATLQDRRTRYSDLRGKVAARQDRLAEKRVALSDWEERNKQRELDAQGLEALIVGHPEEDRRRLLAGLAARVRLAGADPARARRSVQEEITALRRAATDAAQALSSAQSAAAAATATRDAAARSLAAREEEAGSAAQALDTLLRELDMSAEEVRAAGLAEAEIVALEEGVRRHAATLATLRESLAQLGAQLGAAPFDPAELAQVSRDLTATEAALNSGRERAGSLTEQERSLRERLTRRAEIEAQAAEASRQLDTWQTLHNALRVNEFQQFMLAEVEAQLLTRAGHLLHQISDGRYRLTLEKGEYVVQDLWNAGEVRAVKTLSGGETFLASLALAISLSDYLAGNRQLGALFLDEGFGTLDPQALEAVATALENLRVQGRMVGVVTHVESLSERLPSRLLVSKSVAGSTVQRVG